MAIASTNPTNVIIIGVGKLHPDYTIRLEHPVDRVYPMLSVYNNDWVVNTEIRLAEHHWDIPTIDRLVVKSIAEIERKSKPKKGTK